MQENSRAINTCLHVMHKHVSAFSFGPFDWAENLKNAAAAPFNLAQE